MNKYKGFLVFLFFLGLSACTKKKLEEVSPLLNRYAYEEDFSIFPNPDRGVYYSHEIYKGSQPVSVAYLNQLRSKEYLSLLYCGAYLRDFMNKKIDDAHLALLQSNFDAVRKAGFRVILRFAYSYQTSDNGYDAPLAVTLEHIEQLKPILQKNADVISVVEMGFIGVWGEWYYSTHYGNQSTPNYALRKQVYHALMNAVPQERMVAVRTPAQKLALLELTHGDTLTRESAYENSLRSRTAFHNDCFLANANDMGTFRNLDDKQYLEAESKYVCMGGETCQLDPQFAACSNAIREMERAHWSHFRYTYHPDVIRYWKNNQCFDQMIRRLGYRFVLVDAYGTKEPKRGALFETKCTIENKGFAAPYNSFGVSLDFRNSETGKIEYTKPTDLDVRRVAAGTRATTSLKTTLPAQMPVGTYDVLLRIHSPEPTIANRPEYSIRMASKGVWDEKMGGNVLYSIVLE